MDAALAARQHDELSPLLEGLPSQPPPRLGPAGDGGRSVAGWFRGAWSRVAGSAGIVRHDHESGPRTVTPAAAPARVTMSLQAAVGVRRPLPLQFPRGSAEQFSIGRDANCDLAIADMTVSRRHATLERTRGRLAAHRPGIDQRHPGQRLAGPRKGQRHPRRPSELRQQRVPLAASPGGDPKPPGGG